MARRLGFAVALTILTVPGLVQAQYGRRFGGAMTPFGPVYNPAMTPEWRQSGGNPEVWQQLMMQKMAAQQQAAFQKQVQAYQKWAKANPKEAAALEKQNQAMLKANNPDFTQPAPRRKASKKGALKASRAKPKTKADPAKVDDEAGKTTEATAAETSATESTAKPADAAAPTTAKPAPK